MSKLKIACIQFNPKWKEVKSNLIALSYLLDKVPVNTDLIILPEMFSTGFDTDPDSLVQTGEETLDWMISTAKHRNATITGSYIAKSGQNFLNRLGWVSPNGDASFYDKRHLFSYAGEHKRFESGDVKIFPQIKEWTLQPLICYDLRFPVWSRNTNDYDIAIYVANWPKVRREAWLALLRARAIENQCYCIGVNRSGKDGNKLEYSGDTVVFDFEGNQMDALGPEELILNIELDKNELMSFRSRLPFLEDRDEFIIR